MHAKFLQSCQTLCDPIDCSPPGSFVNGIFQARILQWVAILTSGDLPNPGSEPTSLVSPALAGRFFTTAPAGKPLQTNNQLLKKTHTVICDSKQKFHLRQCWDFLPLSRAHKNPRGVAWITRGMVCVFWCQGES